MNFGRYLAYMCLGCGRWNSREIQNAAKLTDREKEKRLNELTCKCVFCNKSFKFLDRRQGGARTEHKWLNDSSLLNEYISLNNTK